MDDGFLFVPPSTCTLLGLRAWDREDVQRRGISTAGPGHVGRGMEHRGCQADASTALSGGEGESWDFTSQA